MVREGAVVTQEQHTDGPPPDHGTWPPAPVQWSAPTPDQSQGAVPPIWQPPQESPSPPATMPPPTGEPGWPQPAWSPPDGAVPAAPSAIPAPGSVDPPAAPPAIAPPARRGLAFPIAVAVVVGLIAGLLGGVAADRISAAMDAAPTGQIEPLEQAAPVQEPLRDGSIAEIAERVLPGVVSLAVSSTSGRATGSGFIVRPDGYIVTNNHVIADAANRGRITVVFSNDSQARGRLVGRNVSYDLAVVKVDRADLPALPLGNSDSVRVGEPAIAIGSPLGLDGTVTVGIVSALNRPVTAGGTDETSFINAVQTDAAINPGNSGGPLLNAKGAVIGVNSAIATLPDRTETGSIGLGFAIPVNTAKRIVEEIIATGSSQTPVIGVSLDNAYTGAGARIESVEPNSPADLAGIEAGDIIVAIDGEAVADATELVVAIRANAPGDTITVTVKDRGDVEVTLEGRDDL